MSVDEKASAAADYDYCMKLENRAAKFYCNGICTQGGLTDGGPLYIDCMIACEELSRITAGLYWRMVCWSWYIGERLAIESLYQVRVVNCGFLYPCWNFLET